MVFTNSGLLALSLWASSTPWTKSLPRCFHRTDLSFGDTQPYHEDPGFSQTTIRHFDGGYGIGGNQRNVEDGWRHELPRCDPDTSTRSEFPFWVKWPQPCILASGRFTLTASGRLRPRRSSKIKPRYMRGVCVCDIWTDVKLLLFEC